MLRSRSKSSPRSKSSLPVHFAPGPAGTLRWMLYWLVSRSANLLRVLQEGWVDRLRPVLGARRRLARRARIALARSRTAAEPYPSLAAAVQEAQRGSRYRGNASGISATT